MNAFDKGFFGEIQKTAANKVWSALKSGFMNPDGVRAAQRRLNIGRRAASSSMVDAVLHPIDTARAASASLGGRRPLAPSKFNAAQQFINRAKWGARARKALPYAAAGAALYGGYRLLRNKDDEDRRR